MISQDYPELMFVPSSVSGFSPCPILKLHSIQRSAWSDWKQALDQKCNTILGLYLGLSTTVTAVYIYNGPEINLMSALGLLSIQEEH